MVREAESHEQDGERLPTMRPRAIIRWRAMGRTASGDPAMAFEPSVGSPGLPCGPGSCSTALSGGRALKRRTFRPLTHARRLPRRDQCPASEVR